MNKKTFNDTFETKKGLIVNTRPITSEDAPYLVDIFEHMSAESRYNRFLQTADHVDMDRIWTEAEKIADISQDNCSGYLAFADLPGHPNAPVGGARYIKISSTQAEIAVSVRDDMQNMGIGTHLLSMLVRSALDDGVDHRPVGLGLGLDRLGGLAHRRAEIAALLGEDLALRFCFRRH